MIDLYTWTTPNGRKISIALEELGLQYKVIPVNLQEMEQQEPGFTAINPNQKIPAIVDHDVEGGPLSIFESGAILLHLAEKTGRLLPQEPRARARVIQWLMYQMSSLGPMLGQAGHFANTAEEKIPYAIERFINESLRIMGVINGALDGEKFLAGEYSIADIASYPWVAAGWTPFSAMMPDEVAKLANIRAWMDRMEARPAVETGMAIPS